MASQKGLLIVEVFKKYDPRLKTHHLDSGYTRINGPNPPPRGEKPRNHFVDILDNGTVCPRNDFARVMGALPRKPSHKGNFTFEITSEMMKERNLSPDDVARAVIALAKEWGYW